MRRTTVIGVTPCFMLRLFGALYYNELFKYLEARVLFMTFYYRTMP